MRLQPTLLVSGPNRPGLVATLSDFVFRNGGNILSADHHAERETGFFFLRLVWDLSAFRLDRAAVRSGIAEVARELGLAGEVTFSDERRRAAVLASRT